MIRVVSYEVSGAAQGRLVADVLRALQPDVVMVQAAPPRLALSRLARRCGLSVAERAGSRRGGTAILVGESVRVRTTATVELTRLPGAPERICAHAIVGVGALRVSVLAAQLGMQPEGRLRHAADIERHLAGVDAPPILGIDLNEPPSGPVARRFAEVLQDAFAVAGSGRGETYPTPDPTARPDHVFLDRGLAVERCHVPTIAPVDRASHHRPVVVDLADSDRDAVRDPVSTTDTETESAA